MDTEATKIKYGEDGKIKVCGERTEETEALP